MEKEKLSSWVGKLDELNRFYCNNWCKEEGISLNERIWKTGRHEGPNKLCLI